VDLRGVALVPAGRDRDLVLARQVRVLAAGDEELRGPVEKLAAVEELLRVEPGDRAAGDVPDVVAAGSGGREAGLREEAKTSGRRSMASQWSWIFCRVVSSP